MAWTRFSFAMAIAASTVWTIGGCNGSAGTMPSETRTGHVVVEPSVPVEPPPHGQVHVDAGNGRGVHVDVERPSGERSVDINVPPRTPTVNP